MQDLTIKCSDFSVQEAQRKIHKNAISKGFYHGDRTLDRALLLIISEALELFESYREGRLGERDKKGLNLNMFEEELADICIRVFDTAEFYKFDLGTAIMEKHNYNITRPHKHNKNF